MKKSLKITLGLAAVVLLCAAAAVLWSVFAGSNSGENTATDVPGSITYDKFMSVELGMTKAQVEGIMGDAGELSKASDENYEMYHWYSSTGSPLQYGTVTFKEGVASGKAQYLYDPSEVAVTQEQYSQIADGMSYGEVCTVCGGEGMLMYETSEAGLTVRIYYWDGEDGSNAWMTARFENDRLAYSSYDERT